MADNHDARPALEQDAQIARVLGAVLFIVLSVFGFAIGTVFTKTLKGDLGLYSVEGGVRGMAIGFTIAVIINLYIWFVYSKTVARDIESEWYEPQSGHHAHH
jgi:hypothetical protein